MWGSPPVASSTDVGFATVAKVSMLMVEASANLVNIDEQTQEEKHLHMLGTSSR